MAITPSSLLSRRTVATLEEVLRLLKTERYTGSILLHFHLGEPKKLEWGKPIQVELYEQPLTNDVEVAQANR